MSGRRDNGIGCLIILWRPAFTYSDTQITWETIKNRQLDSIAFNYHEVMILCDEPLDQCGSVPIQAPTIPTAGSNPAL